MPLRRQRSAGVPDAVIEDNTATIAVFERK